MPLIALFFVIIVLRILLQMGVFGSTTNLKNTVQTKVAHVQNDIQKTKERATAEQKRLEELANPKVPKSVGNTIKNIFND